MISEAITDKMVEPNEGEPGEFPFYPVVGGAKSEAIVLQIEAAILGGHFQSGDRLPSERRLQNMFQASRGAIREALRALREKGLLEAKKGARGGYYIKELDINQAIDHLAVMIKQQKAPLEKLLEFQYALDQAVLIAAIGHAAESEIERLADLADQLVSLCREPEPDFDQIALVDKRLNLLMVEMSKNPFFKWIMGTVQMAFRAYEFIVYEHPDVRRAIALNWRSTAGALKKRDLQKALGLYGHWYVLLEQCLRDHYGDKAFCSLEPEAG